MVSNALPPRLLHLGRQIGQGNLGVESEKRKKEQRNFVEANRERERRYFRINLSSKCARVTRLHNTFSFFALLDHILT